VCNLSSMTEVEHIGMLSASLSGMQTAAVCCGWCVGNTKSAALPLPCRSVALSRLGATEQSPSLCVLPRQLYRSNHVFHIAQCSVFKDKIKQCLYLDRCQFRVATRLSSLTLRKDVLQPRLEITSEIFKKSMLFSDFTPVRIEVDNHFIIQKRRSKWSKDS